MFLNEVNGCTNPLDVMPIIAAANVYMINVYRNDLFFLCVVAEEVAPLLVIEFLHRVHDIFTEYFSRVDEVTIKENFSTVYLILEEMCDNGFPFITEPNALLDMIVPPSISNRIVAAVSGKSSVAEVLPDGAVSSTPWRRKGVHYNMNTVYFDINEEIDCIIGANGQIVTAQVHGELVCTSKLSGMPELLLSIDDTRAMVDYSLHPCIRVKRFEQENVLSFVPPDGMFTMMRYKLDPGCFSNTIGNGKTSYSNLPIPVYCRPQITFSENGGHVEIMAGVKPVSKFDPKAVANVEDMAVVIPFPLTVRSTDLKCNVGVVTSNEATKMCRWHIGKMPKDISPKLSGTFSLVPEAPIPEESMTISLEFKLASASVSGLSVNELTIINETYEPYKYVRSTLRSGKLQIRS
uniref:MHD domain-containing protein n=1 Tax=Mucochytrium quahogii TaxID=96639 RepID=A0A7S2RNC4_9STRA|mmetsp:Transcript_37737/g.61490  ORF Transcript_37737/g.61490 Transcript_37737/m.61490 type:complete len:406 (-) Transcript_37737:152-1369(-)